MIWILAVVAVLHLESVAFSWRTAPAITSRTSFHKVRTSFSQEAVFLSSRSSFSQKSRSSISMTIVEKPPTLEQTTIKATPLPAHPKLVTGKLENGFTYVILPNAVPTGRFEAHLEVMSGSANELERQQGMAHLLEHVAYMGSPKRQLISGTGSRTNAYTDFHHTVFFAACPSQTPDQFWKKPMLPMALDALLDVMTTRIDDDRLEKERAAVLSEASMVNKMEYRVECQILSTLHSENRISQRFPIGKESLIKAWKREDLELYHQLHYRPDNVVLFLVGDLDVSVAVETVKQKFGHLQPRIDADKIFREANEFPAISMRSVSRHFPPVIHIWSTAPENVKGMLPQALIMPVVDKKKEMMKIGDDNVKGAIISNLKVFSHELLMSFSFHLFAKRPIEPITSVEALRRELMKRIVFTALQIRLNVMQRQDPLFTFADFNQLNWPREGCAVCSLDLTTDTLRWKEAVTVAVQEIRRLGMYGLTSGELERFAAATMTEAMQASAEMDQRNNEEVLRELMEHEACGHTFMHPNDSLELTRKILSELTLEQVNQRAKELCEHLSHMDPSNGVIPAATVACAPTIHRDGTPFILTNEEVAQAVMTALSTPLDPVIDTIIPKTLIPDTMIQEKLAVLPNAPPRFVTGTEILPRISATSALGLADSVKKVEPKVETEATKRALGITQRRLQNGVKVNLKSLGTEPQRVSLRMYLPGGRIREEKNTLKSGAIVVGARTMQEGGAFGNVSRESVEMFCIDHLVMVDIIAQQDALILDFQSVTTSPDSGLSGSNSGASSGSKESGISGFEAVLQVAHIIMTDFTFEEDAFHRAIQSAHEQFDSTVKGLETACVESLTYSLTSADTRYLAPNHKTLDALTLDAVKEALKQQLIPENLEVSICGDIPVPEMERLALKYLGTIPPSVDVKTKAAVFVDTMIPNPTVDVTLMGKGNRLAVYLPDSDERAMGYIAGPAPNRWGVFADGTMIADLLGKTNNYQKDASVKKGKDNSGDKRRDHPLFGHVALLVLQEVANRRLFSVVREERQLTYDASFTFQGAHDGILGGWYQVAVTAAPAKVNAAVRACQEALTSLKGPFGVLGDSVQSAKRTLLNKFRTEAATNRFWVEQMSGTQVESLPLKTLSATADFETVLNSVTVQDIQAMVEVFAFEETNMTVCVGVTGPKMPADILKAKQQ